MEEKEYRTVGELAKEVGTTVRTIQYYDQQGLLPPSAKGPGNQRLYAPEDVEELYRIFTLKYLGFSLADIREQKGSVIDAASFRRILMDTMEALEEEFQNLVKRLSILRTLFDLASDDDAVDWVTFARTIETDEPGELFWHRFDDIATAPISEFRASVDARERGLAVAKWHELIADAISFMSERVSPEDPRAKQLANRFRQLEDEQAGSLDQAFILVENVVPHHGASGSFDVLRDSVVRYLEDVANAHDASPEAGL